MNLFIDGFDEPNVNFPDKFLLETISGFSNATFQLAQLSIIRLDYSQRARSYLNTNFQFQVVLSSDYLKGYSFKVFEFGYDVTIYPVVVNLEETIGEELGLEADFDNCYTQLCNDENDFKETLRSIFASEHFKKTVGGLIKIAKSNTNT
ncbi:hypothetical protein [Candidatus Methylobacter oryzae]|uniref:Uncharacterized protein n=1 Tax=Candidatus Methylobacter oryzae TaxID=2497749 RepID=A0ABY3C7P2_9GAMM|nr:hypothetical protein [Candidatus Methylobacter oryzae]TRW91483.1 hypothetical protein EKO24_016340 [Candidatus Methylobacter oryzae]